MDSLIIDCTDDEKNFFLFGVAWVDGRFAVCKISLHGTASEINGRASGYGSPRDVWHWEVLICIQTLDTLFSIYCVSFSDISSARGPSRPESGTNTRRQNVFHSSDDSISSHVSNPLSKAFYPKQCLESRFKSFFVASSWSGYTYFLSADIDPAFNDGSSIVDANQPSFSLYCFQSSVVTHSRSAISSFCCGRLSGPRKSSNGLTGIGKYGPFADSRTREGGLTTMKNDFVAALSDYSRVLYQQLAVSNSSLLSVASVGTGNFLSRSSPMGSTGSLYEFSRERERSTGKERKREALDSKPIGSTTSLLEANMHTSAEVLVSNTQYGSIDEFGAPLPYPFPVAPKPQRSLLNLHMPSNSGSINSSPAHAVETVDVVGVSDANKVDFWVESGPVLFEPVHFGCQTGSRSEQSVAPLPLPRVLRSSNSGHLTYKPATSSYNNNNDNYASIPSKVQFLKNKVIN